MAESDSDDSSVTSVDPSSNDGESNSSSPNSIDGNFVDGDENSDQEQHSDDGDQNDDTEETESGACGRDESPSPTPLKTIGGHNCHKCKKTIKGHVSKFEEHYKAKHSPAATKKFFACSMCKRSYTTSRALIKHLREQHTKDFTGEKQQKHTPTPQKVKAEKSKESSHAAKADKHGQTSQKKQGNGASGTEKKGQSSKEIREIQRQARSFVQMESKDGDKESRKKQAAIAKAHSEEKNKKEKTRKRLMAAAHSQPPTKRMKKTEPESPEEVEEKPKSPLKFDSMKKEPDDDSSEQTQEKPVEVREKPKSPLKFDSMKKEPDDDSSEQTQEKPVEVREKPKSPLKFDSMKREPDDDSSEQTQEKPVEVREKPKQTQEKRQSKTSSIPRNKIELAEAEQAAAEADQAAAEAAQAEAEAYVAVAEANQAVAEANRAVAQLKVQVAEAKARAIRAEIHPLETQILTRVPETQTGETDRPITPTYIQIPGPHLDDILEGRDPFASVPTDYTATDEAMRRALEKRAATKASGEPQYGAFGTGTSKYEIMRQKPSEITDTVAYGAEKDRHEIIDEDNQTIASSEVSKALIGFNDNNWRTWSEEFSFFACIAVFKLNKVDNDNLVYVHRDKVKSKADFLLREAEDHLSSIGVRLMVDGKFNLYAVKHLSEFYEIVINVWSERRVNLTWDLRHFDVIFEDMDWPALHLMRLEDGHFRVIKNILALESIFTCEQCGRDFTQKHNLSKHMKGDRCPFVRFMQHYGPDAMNQFFQTPTEEYMVRFNFPGGRVKPKVHIADKLEKYNINVGPNFTFNDYYCVSDIETFLTQMIHKTIDGEEMVIGANHKLLFQNHHDPACVSIVSNLGGQYSVCQTFMSTDGSSNFIKKYSQYLKEMSNAQYELLMDKHKPIIDELHDLQMNFMANNKIGLANNVGSILKQIEREAKKLQIFFFNSVFDLNCMVRHGLCHFIEEICEQRMNAIKNGNDYVMLSGEYVVFKDALKFTAAKVSLPAFLYTYNVPDKYSKLKFPYEMVTSPTKLMTPLPVPYESFYSELRQENTLSGPRAKFESLIENGLSKDDALKGMKMTDEPPTGQVAYELILDLCRKKNFKYLYQLMALYCCADCTGLMIAIGRMRDSFKTLTNLDMFNYLTLPSMAFDWALRQVGDHPDRNLNHFVQLREEAYNLIIPGLRGGITMIGNRLSIAGYTKIKPHQVPPEKQKVVKKQLYLDANTLYGGTCNMDNVVLGNYAIRHKRNNFAFDKVQEKGLLALTWLRFMEEVVLNKPMRTIRSTYSEKTLTVGGTLIRLDGWMDVVRDEVSGKMKGFTFEFHDWTHCHPDLFEDEDEFENGVNPVTKRNNKESYEKTVERDQLIEQHPDVITHYVMWSHDWVKRIERNQTVKDFCKNCINTMGPDPVEMKCSWERMLELILDDKIHGLVVCSMKTPDHLINKFSIFPPYFNHKKLGRNDCCKVEKDYAEKHGLLRIPQRILTNELHAENTVITTDLLKFYVIKLDLECTNIETVVQFRGAAKVLENMMAKCKEYRDKGVATGNSVFKEVGKLMLNGFYGSSLLKMESRRTISYVKKKNLKRYTNKPEMVCAAFAGPSWKPSSLAEVELRKFKVTEIKPKQLGIWILNASKMVMLDFIYNVLHKYLDPTCWEINGMDTDGIIISISGDDLMSICKPKLLNEFRDKYKTIFAVDKDQTHVPHLFKIEKESVIFVGLATKSYFMLNKDSPIGKVATKGIPNKTEENEDLVGLVNFLQTLFDIHPGPPPMATVRGIRCDNFKNMATYVQMKRGLSRLSAKQGFHECAIHYFPLELKDDPEELEDIYPYTDTCQCYDIQAAWEHIKRLSIENPKMKLTIPDTLVVECSNSVRREIGTGLSMQLDRATSDSREQERDGGALVRQNER